MISNHSARITVGPKAGDRPAAHISSLDVEDDEVPAGQQRRRVHLIDAQSRMWFPDAYETTQMDSGTMQMGRREYSPPKEVDVVVIETVGSVIGAGLYRMILAARWVRRQAQRLRRRGPMERLQVRRGWKPQRREV